jgi:hypothetical protein
MNLYIGVTDKRGKGEDVGSNLTQETENGGNRDKERSRKSGHQEINMNRM